MIGPASPKLPSSARAAKVGNAGWSRAVYTGQMLRISTVALVFAGIVSAVAAKAAQQAPPSNAAAAASFNQAVQLHDGGKFAEAAALFKQAIDQGFQPVWQARVRLARAHVRAGNVDPGLTEIEALANAGFSAVTLLTTTDFDSVRALPRFKAIEAKVNANAFPCANDPKYHAFDFWIGEWDVQPTAGPRAPVGQGATSIVESQLSGCVVQENWLPNGKVAMGKSFNIYNTATKMWEQYYVDTRGTITHYKGNFKEDGHLYFEADQQATGAKVRMTFFNQGPNQVRQLGHMSTDGGKTWTVTFDLTYVRKTAK